MSGLVLNGRTFVALRADARVASSVTIKLAPGTSVTSILFGEDTSLCFYNAKDEEVHGLATSRTHIRYLLDAIADITADKLAAISRQLDGYNTYEMPQRSARKLLRVIHQ